jgi:hypothetical protein
MERFDDIDFDTDLDDDDETGMARFFSLKMKVSFFSKDETNGYTLPRLSFEEKVGVHRINRLTETFGQMESKTKRDILIPLRCKTPCDAGKYNR